MTFDEASGATSRLTLRCVEPAVDRCWLRLIAELQGGLFHSPPWLRAVADTYDLPIRAWIAADGDGTLLGGAAFCEIDDFAGHRLVCLPFSDCADPLFAGADVWRALFDRLCSAGVPVHLRCLSEDRIQPEDGLSVNHRAPWHRLNVTGTEDELWRRIAPPARRSIRRAERSGVEIRPLHGAADREAFHRLHVALRKRKYRLLAQPQEFLEALECRFEVGHGWQALAAVHDGRMIAGTVYLRWGDVLYYKFNASESDALAVRPNHLLVWAGIRLARLLGCTALDLGPSRPSQPGLIRFKRSFDAEELTVRFLSWSPPGWRQPEEAGSRALAELAEIFTSPDLPDEVTARAGASLYRYFA